MRPRVLIFALAFALMTAATARIASAAPIQYTLAGTVTAGEFAGSPLANQPFTITFAADTDDIIPVVVGLAVNNQSVTLHLAGTDYNGFFISSSYLFPDGTFAHVGVPAGDYWEDALMYVSSPGLVGYDLSSPVGPVTSRSR
jgi:hypothetical protein